jgi:hypothetical protein
MKRALLTTMVLAALASGAAQGQDAERKYYASEHYRASDTRVIVPRYLHCLKSENDGVVSSTLAVFARMNLYNEGFHPAKVQSEVARLSEDGATPAIRYRAYLVSMLLENPGFFAEEGTRDYMSDDDLFLAISTRLSRSLLSLNEDGSMHSAGR